MVQSSRLSAVGLGLRREILDDLITDPVAFSGVDFFEVAPENWMKFGGRLGKQFRQLSEQYKFYCHGLSLSLGGPDDIDVAFVKAIKAFLDLHQIEVYSEHLSYCSGAGHLYDLMPIPFTQEAVQHVAKRVKQVEDIIERPLIIENVSFYTGPGAEMTELEFVTSVLKEADCKLLLDVNNIYVNSINHQYDAAQFLAAMPTERIAYIHIAGHYQQAKDLIIDTHGSNVVDPVWDLLTSCYTIHGVFPTLLERDFNLPPVNELMDEVNQIKNYQHDALSHIDVHSRSA